MNWKNASILYLCSILFILSASLVMGVQSTDRTDYYFHDGLWVTDGVQGDVGLNGTTPSNGASPTTTGWAGIVGAPTYDNGAPLAGNVSLKIDSGENFEKVFTDNNSFRGMVVMNASCGGSATDCGLTAYNYHTATNRHGWDVRNDGGVYKFAVKIDTNFYVCAEHGSGVNTLIINYSDPNAIRWYQIGANGTSLCRTLSTTSDHSFYNPKFLSGNTGTYQIDAFFVTNDGVIPQGADTISITSPPSGWLNQTQINFTISASANVDIYISNTSNATGLYASNVAPSTYATNVSEVGTYFIIACITGDCSTNASVNWTYDNTAPSISGFTDANVTTNTTFSRTLSAFDPHLYSMNVTCLGAGGFTYENTSIIPATTASTLINLTLNESLVCAYEVCDGHTRNDITPFIDIVQNSTQDVYLRWDNQYQRRVSIAPNSAPATITYIEKRDRVQFKIMPVNTGVNNRIVLQYETGANSQYFSASPFAGHIIDPDIDTWFDMVGGESNLAVFKLNPTTYELAFDTRGAVILKSTGKLNCVSGSFTASAIDPIIVDKKELVTPFQCQNASTSDVLMYAFLFLVLVTMYVVVKRVFNVPIISIIVLLGFVWYGLSLIGCWEYLGVLMIALSGVMALYEAIM